MAGCSRIAVVAAVALLAWPSVELRAQPPQTPTRSAEADKAATFGKLEDVRQMSLSPDGSRIAFVAPGDGRSTRLFVAAVTAHAVPREVATATGDPERLRSCYWVSNDRLVCNLYLVTAAPEGPVAASRTIALDADGGNVRMLSRGSRDTDAYYSLSGGQVIDTLPAEDGAVLMARRYVPQQSSSTRLNDTREGLGVDRLDTATLAAKEVEPPRKDAIEYISDGKGNVRILGTQVTDTRGYDRGTVDYYFRLAGSRDWKKLSTVRLRSGEGFDPYAVDPDRNLAYGFKKKDGRLALYSVALDGSGTETAMLSRSDVDVDGLVRIGRNRRVVGATYATEQRHAAYFDPRLKALAASLSKALPGLPLIEFVDSSRDESKLLIWAGSDTDPGRYYLFDKATRGLNELTLARPDLEGAMLAEQKPVSYTAADGTVIPAYLTIPAGSSGRNLPAIVMPHGGPSARDEWGFDWLAQYFAARGFAVFQPQFRGSAGYGDDFFVKNGFQSWRIAIGDVNDAGRWLVSQGVADPTKLAIFGWSYGGYAALQANVLDPKLYKAAVAVAPVTDLGAFALERSRWSDYGLTSDFIGSGPHLLQGSPAQNAATIVAPVLLFHGELDLNVGIHQSRLMDSRLKAAGQKSELIVYPGLDHQLEDSVVRADLLRRSDAFIRAALGMK